MDQLIDTIRTAIASGASTEHKAAGVKACRTIVAALDTEPGKVLTSPTALGPSPATRPTLDQMLDLVIARLTTIANARDAATALPPATKKVTPAVTQLPPSPSRGLRVPAAVVAPRTPARSARPAQTKHPNPPTRKP